MESIRSLVQRVLYAALVVLSLGFSASPGAAPAEIDVDVAAVHVQEQQVKCSTCANPRRTPEVIVGALLISLGQVEQHLPELEAYKEQPLSMVCVWCAPPAGVRRRRSRR